MKHYAPGAKYEVCMSLGPNMKCVCLMFQKLFTSVAVMAENTFAIVRMRTHAIQHCALT